MLAGIMPNWKTNWFNAPSDRKSTRLNTRTLIPINSTVTSGTRRVGLRSRNGIMPLLAYRLWPIADGLSPEARNPSRFTFHASLITRYNHRDDRITQRHTGFARHRHRHRIRVRRDRRA